MTETHEVSDCISELTLASLLRGVWYGARAASQGLHSYMTKALHILTLLSFEPA